MKPDFVEPNIRKLTVELAEIRAEHEKLQPKIVAAKELVKIILSMNPAVFVKPGRI